MCKHIISARKKAGEPAFRGKLKCVHRPKRRTQNHWFFLRVMRKKRHLTLEKIAPGQEPSIDTYTS